MQLQLLTRRNDPAPAQTWGQDAAKVLAGGHDAATARRLQNVLKTLLKDMPASSRLGLLLPAMMLAAGLGGCDLLAPKQAGEVGAPPLTPEQEAAKAALPEPVRKITPQTPEVRAYRKTGARHIYAVYKARIFKGKLPPLVYAVVTVETHLDGNGQVEAVTFMRAPEQAPEVSLEIAELIWKASPLPSPGKVGAHTYVETWLWDKSGKFQLDTLTQGQRSR